MFNFGGVATGDHVEYIFRNFEVRGNPWTGPRSVDGVTRGTFGFGTGQKEILFLNVDVWGNDGFVYSSGDAELIMSHCYYNGLRSSESCIQPFGNTRLRFFDNEVYDNGPPIHLAPDGKGRGRTIYFNNLQRNYVAFNRFVNNEGHTIQYFTSGADTPEENAPPKEQIFMGNSFIMDNGSTSGIGIYSGRASNNLKSIGDNFISVNGSRQTAINTAGGMTIANAVFEKGNISNTFSVGTNNVFRDTNEAKVVYRDCRFNSSGVDLYSLTSNGVAFESDFVNCYFYRDTTSNYQIRTIAGSSNPMVQHKANFKDCSFEGQTLTGQSGFRFAPRIHFFETGNYVHIKHDGSEFNQNSNPNTGLVVLANTIRDSVTLEFVNCSSRYDSVYIEISDSISTLIGKNNKFKRLIIDWNNQSVNLANNKHGWEFGEGLSPDTLTAASLLDNFGSFGYNEFIVTGTTSIDRIFFSSSRENHEGRVIKGNFTLYFQDALTLNTGGNIDITAPKVVAANTAIHFYYNNITKKAEIRETSTP